MKLFNKKTKEENTINNNIKISEKDFVGKNYDYYQVQFIDFEKNGKKSTFNLPALLVAPYWYIYRKMTFTGAFIVGVQVILATLAYFLKTPLWIAIYIASFLLYVRAAFYGNFDYYKRIQNLKKDSNNIDDKFKDRFLKDKSGVDVYMTICWIVGSIIIYAFALFM